MDDADEITRRRLAIWDRYYDWAAEHEAGGRFRRPVVPDYVGHNAHMFHVLLPTPDLRTHFIKEMDKRNVNTVFHYVPLHTSTAGRTHCRVSGSLGVTEDLSERLVRLPLWLGIEQHLDRVFECADQVLTEMG